LWNQSLLPDTRQQEIHFDGRKIPGVYHQLHPRSFNVV
jgi:hypothetical protein